MSMFQEFAKPSVDSFKLPCGYLDEDGNLHTDVDVREMTGEEEEILAAKNMAVMKKMNKILSRCTTAIGSITDPRQIEAIIPDLTQGDRVYLLFAIRRVSLGDDFPFTTQCPQCEQKSNLTVNLSELAIKEMADPKLRTYPVELNKSHKKVTMKVLTGRGEDSISKAATVGKDIISVAMLARMEAIDGRPATLADLKALPLSDRNQLKDEWQEHEGGVDTEVDIQCPACDNEYKADIDIASQGFFSPSAVLKTWKASSNS